MSATDISGVLPDRATAISRVVSFAVSIAGVLLAWEVGSILLDDPRILPSPIVVFELMIQYSLEGDAARGTALVHLRATVVRVVAASLVTLGFATAIGGLMGGRKRFEEGLLVWVPFWLTVPTVVVVLVTMVLFDFSVVAVYASAIIVATPFAVINIWEGVRDIDVALLEMAAVFDAPRTLVWKDVYLYHLLPYIFSSYRYVLGIVWKIVILGEVFGLNTGIGSMFRFYFTIGEVDSMLAYVVLFVCVLFVIEYVVIATLQRWCFRWRMEARE